ncbi:Glycosyltransferase, GT2 family [Kosakonia arachidis]|uniref:Glycosyltransferase, GT2 family n=1 Tax=Kosakonia arachidis TaxID=551989 RepID=A0A1I7E8Q1_9ENTR|nr:glycosyltransferase [Kosakonia arachidis]SFU20310.1 Glycosyltransferase, GT2 family [Kosakonia arachidis]
MSVPELVSIIIPAWKATWFEIALQSAMQQNYGACEIIISDDSKDDSIARIVDKLSPISRWPIVYQRNVSSLGEMGNTASCLAKAQGKYIKFLHDDDVLKINCVSELVQAINRHSDIVMATSHREMIDVQGNPLPVNLGTTPLFNVDSVLHGRDVISLQADTPLNFIGEPSVVLIRSDILRTILAEGEPLSSLGGEPMPFLGDLAMYLKVLHFGHLALVCQTLSQYRISRSQSLATATEKADVVSETHKKMPLVIKKLGWYDPSRKQDHIRIAPLSHPEQFTEQNLLQEIALSAVNSRLNRWLAERKLYPVQQQQALDFFAAQSACPRCTVYIDARNSERNAWDRTFNSLSHQVAGVSWQIIALINEHVDYLPAGTEQIRLDLPDGLEALNTKNRELSSDWLLFLDAGCQLLSSGLVALSSVLSRASQLDAIYTDIICPLGGKPLDTLCRPDFNLDLLLSTPGQMSGRWLFRRDRVVAAGGFNPACPQKFEFELQLRLIENTGAEKIGHLSEPLVQEIRACRPGSAEPTLLLSHLHRRGFPHAEIQATDYGPWRVKYHHQDTPKVTIAVLGGDIDSISRCVTGLLNVTRYPNYELVIVADKRAEAGREIWLESVAKLDPERIRVVYYPALWQRAGMANMASLNAQGDYLLFLSSSIQVMDAEWLDNMLNHALRPEVGIVGGKQLYDNGMIRHAGYILGLQGGVAGEPFYGTDDKNSGYMGRLHADQNYSAVSGDFMLVSKDICFAVNGFDADLNCYDDIDFCLRVRELGGLTVWTPYARGCRHPEKTVSATTLAQREAETDTLFERWRSLISQDPAYNPNLSLTAAFTLQDDSRQSWRPLFWRPVPVVLPVTGEQNRESTWRIAAPFAALRDAGFIDGKSNKILPGLPEFIHYNPDVAVIEQQSGMGLHNWIKKVSRFGSAFTIAQLAPPPPAITLSHTEFTAVQDDYVASVRRNLTYVDRLIVADEYQAEVFADAHSDVIIVPTRLPHASWGQLCCLRNQGEKPRIGLPGSLCHRSVQELIVGLITTLANDVEWVVYGPCLPELRSLLKTLRRETDTEIYHQELAFMSLDLALVPHDGHPLTHAHAHCHLIEYGACAIPVVCSSTLNDAKSLTATRVTNQLSDWQNTIRMHLADTTASEKMGKALQSEVRQHWLLNNDGLNLWSQAWRIR